MKVTVVPAGPKTAAAAIHSLIELCNTSGEKIDITAIYRDPNKAPASLTSLPNFRAVKGDLSDAKSLDFAGAEAVLVITPPAFNGGDIVKNAETGSSNIREAIDRAATVERLVLLSSIGAHLSEGVVS